MLHCCKHYSNIVILLQCYNNVLCCMGYVALADSRRRGAFGDDRICLGPDITSPIVINNLAGRLDPAYRYIIVLDTLWYNPIVNLPLGKKQRARRRVGEGERGGRGKCADPSSCLLNIKIHGADPPDLQHSSAIRVSSETRAHAHFYHNLRREALPHMFPGLWITYR